MSLSKLHELVAEIESTEDRLLRSEILIDLSKGFAEVPANIATRPFPESHKSPACQSDAFVWVMKNEVGELFPYFAVENPQGLSAKALASVLSQTCSGATLQEISSIDDGIVYRIFGETLSMGKGEGLMGMVRKMKELAKKA